MNTRPTRTEADDAFQAVPRDSYHSSTKAKATPAPATAPGAHDDDDIGVASDEDSDE